MTATYKLKRRLTAAQKQMLVNAGELEQRAASLTYTISTLDEERARLLAKAAVLRMEASRE